jgi:hypothetical protein
VEKYKKRRNICVRKEIIGGIKRSMKEGEFKKKMSVIGIVLSFNIDGMKA